MIKTSTPNQNQSCYHKIQLEFKAPDAHALRITRWYHPLVWTPAINFIVIFIVIILGRGESEGHVPAHNYEPSAVSENVLWCLFSFCAMKVLWSSLTYNILNIRNKYKVSRFKKYVIAWHPYLLLKGTVHPKIRSLFTHPQVVPNLYEFLCSAEQIFWIKIFWRTFVTRLFLGTIDFHSRKKILWKSIVPQNCSVSHILQNIFLCVQHKHIHTGLELLEDE